MDSYFWINTKFASAKYNSTYTMQLPRRITLSEKHEVSLLEINYSKFIKTLQTELDGLINISYLENGNILQKTLKIPWIRYNSINHLVYTINDNLQEYTSEIRLNIENEFVEVNSIGGEITFSKALSKVLGLKHVSYSYEKSFAFKHPDLQIYNQFINVCIDIIDSQFAGNKWLQLLRRVYNKETKSNQVQTSFCLPIYFPIIKNDFDVIKVSFVNDKNTWINFDENDNVSLLIHIRKNKSLLIATIPN